MRHFTRLLAVVAAFIGFTIVGVSAAQADIYPYKWSTTTVKVYDNSQYRGVVRAAKTWNAGPSPFTLVGTSTPCNGCVVIADGTTATLPAGAAGAAYIQKNATGTNITHCTAKVNKDRIESIRDSYGDKRAQEYVVNITVHEVGHCIGLDHSTTNAGAQSVMAAQQWGWIYKPTTYDEGELLRQYP